MDINVSWFAALCPDPDGITNFSGCFVYRSKAQGHIYCTPKVASGKRGFRCEIKYDICIH